MQIKADEFLPIVEKAGGLVTFDIEASGLRGDYNSILCASFKPYGKKPFTIMVDRPGNDAKAVRQIRDVLHEYPVWLGFYSKGFDKPMIQTRLLVNGLAPLHNHHHIDLYYVLKFRLLTARRSQAHLLRMLGTKQQKLEVTPNAWNDVLADPRKHLALMRERCESDVEGLTALYEKTKHLIAEIQR